MKNILNVKPDLDLNARLVFCNELVDIADLKNKRVLDIGCGFGWFELNALKKGVKEIAGIEISAEDLKAARSNIKDGRAVFKIGGALKLPFKDNYFDTVVAWEVVEHFQKIQKIKCLRKFTVFYKRKGLFTYQLLMILFGQSILILHGGLSGIDIILKNDLLV